MVIPAYRLLEYKYFLQMEEDFKNMISKSWDDDFRQNNPDLVEN
jgi:hypothetical protein